jgi:hypothetical protein
MTAFVAGAQFGSGTEPVPQPVPNFCPASTVLDELRIFARAHTYLAKNVAKLDDAEITANRNGASNDPKADAAVRFAAKVTRGQLRLRLSVLHLRRFLLRQRQLLRCSATGAHRAWPASATPRGMRLSDRSVSSLIAV